MVKRKRKPFTLGPVRLYPEQDTDEQLIHWQNQFANELHGAKTQAIKNALLRGINASDTVSADVPTSVGIDPQALQQVVEAAVARAVDMERIRRVVEAAVTSAMAQYGGPLLARADKSVAEQAEADQILDAMGDQMILSGDDLDE